MNANSSTVGDELKDDILVNFQAITECFDVDIAQIYLNEHNWDLSKAAQAYESDNRQARNFSQTPGQQNQAQSNYDEEGNYIPPPNDNVYRQDRLIQDDPTPMQYFFGFPESAYDPYTTPSQSTYHRSRTTTNNTQQQQQQQPFVDDLLFGTPVTEKVKNMFSGFKSYFSKFKGVSPGGEEFTCKLDKSLPKGTKRPNFLHGTLDMVMKSHENKKPLLFYISGEDKISKQFETKILIKEEILFLLDTEFECLGLNASSNEGAIVIKKMGQEIIPVVLIIKLEKDTNQLQIKFLLEGENLTHEDGTVFFSFLQQAIDEFKQEEKTKLEERKQNNEEEKEEEEFKSSLEDYVNIGKEDEDLKLAQKLQAEIYYEEEINHAKQEAERQAKEKNDKIKREQELKLQKELQKQEEERLKKEAEQQKVLEQQRKVIEKEEQKRLKVQRLGEEPPSDNPDIVTIVFRKPTGNERIQRRFLKSDQIQALYDFIDLQEPDKIGFEMINKNEEIKYELVTSPTPQIKVLSEREKTLEEYGFSRSTLINIKQTS